MTTQQESQELSLILDEVEVVAVERLSPSFVRVELGGPALADFGVDGPLYDLRIKLVFPNDAGELPSFAGADESWWDTWLELPEAERGHMRTYTVRAVRGAGVDTRMVVDLVLHPAEGQAGPGSTWAEQASVGDRLVTMAPRRGVEYGGIEFAPGTARELLLVADETAVPAVCSILEDLDDDARGVALLEVPLSADAAALAEQVAPAERRRGLAAPGRGAARIAPRGRGAGQAGCRWRGRPRRGGRHGGGPRPVGDPGVLLLRGGHRRTCGHRGPRPRRALCLDRRGVEGGHVDCVGCW